MKINQNNYLDQINYLQLKTYKFHTFHFDTNQISQL